MTKRTTLQLTRRDWLKAGTAVAGSLFVAGTGAAQSVTVKGYTPNPENPIRLNANENPYGVSIVARNAMTKAYDEANLYTGRTIQRELRAQIAAMENVKDENVVVGASSSELLKTAALVNYLEGGRKILAPEPTFHLVSRYGESLGMETVRVPVDDSLTVNLDMLREAYTDDVSLIYICNPNNPLPTIIEKNALRDFCLEMAGKAMVFIDEAYYEFVDDPDFDTMIPLAAENENIFVTRTASKIHGMAGMAVGFGYGSKSLIEKVGKFKTGKVNTLGLRAAIASYKDMDTQNFIREKCRQSRDIVNAMLDKHGIEYPKSHTNFIFFKTGLDNKEVRDRLLKHGVSISRPFPPYLDWARVSMGKPEDMEVFVKAYEKEFLS